ncbi:MAG: DUF6464 family protein [Cyanobacteriota bacterium]|nr:DUF6464 family protein [Cyanobacteriota bacterium]
MTEENVATIEILLIFAVGLTPAVFSVWYSRKLRNRARHQFSAARNSTSNRIFSQVRTSLPTPSRRIYTIGDRTCQFNARSPYLRCAIHPQGPCKNCRDYQPR